MNAAPASPPLLRLPAWIRTPAALYLGLALLSFGGCCAAVLVMPRYVPIGADEFANLLAGQTFAHGALTNPPHPLWQFFETQHVLMQPTYMAKYPPAQGLFLAVGIWLGRPVLGVWLASTLFVVALAWMVRGFFSARWALLAGVVAIGQFGLGCYWTQSYWGGAPAALGGALVFGGTRRMLRTGRNLDALLLGAGVVLLMLSRPFEGLLLCVVPAVLLLHALGRRRLRLPAVGCVSGVVLAGGLFQLAYNARVTGHPWQMPYLAYEKQYSAAPLFIWQKTGPDPHFRHKSMDEFYQSYIKPNSVFREPLARVWWTRIRQAISFQLGAYLGLTALVGTLLRPSRWVLLAWLMVGITSTALALAYWVTFHYEAPMAGALVFATIYGLRVLVVKFSWRRYAPWLIGAFGLIYAAFFAGERYKRLPIHPAAIFRQAVIDQITAQGKRYLVIVSAGSLSSPHFDWIYNDAAIDQSPVVWARDRGEPANRELLKYFHDRTPVLFIDSPKGAEWLPYPAPPTLPRHD